MVAGDLRKIRVIVALAKSLPGQFERSYVHACYMLGIRNPGLNAQPTFASRSRLICYHVA
jgi:hypothetical protein